MTDEFTKKQWLDQMIQEGRAWFIILEEEFNSFNDSLRKRRYKNIPDVSRVAALATNQILQKLGVQIDLLDERECGFEYKNDQSVIWVKLTDDERTVLTEYADPNFLDTDDVSDSQEALHKLIYYGWRHMMILVGCRYSTKRIGRDFLRKMFEVRNRGGLTPHMQIKVMFIDPPDRLSYTAIRSNP